MNSKLPKFPHGFDFERATEDERAAYDWGYEAGQNPANLDDCVALLSSVLATLIRLQRHPNDGAGLDGQHR